MRLTLPSKFKLNKILDKKGRLFGKVDLFLPLFAVILITLSYFIGRVLFQKSYYIEVELFASGGEWWWKNPEPPYWLVDPIAPGAIEYDPSGNPLVEILDVQKFEVGERKMLWMKAKLRVNPADRAKQYRFRREPLQVGSVIYISPNNIRIFCNVMWIEGIGLERYQSEKIVTLKEYSMYPWEAEKLQVGDTMRDDDGEIIAEVVAKEVTLAEMTTVDDQGRTHLERDPTRRDVTAKLKIKTTRSKNLEYFSYFQPLKVGFYMWVPLSQINIRGNIISVE